MANYRWPDRNGRSRPDAVVRPLGSGNGGVAAPHPGFRVNGALLLPHRTGALYWADRGTLIVADLHLEKGSAYAPTGQLLPPYDTRATLAGLARAMADHAPRRVICLGDSFHDPEAAGRLSAEDAGRLRTLVDGVEWIWIAGNHDPGPPEGVGGDCVAELTDGPIVFRHEAAGGAGELSGHFHPKARVRTRAHGVSGRCFVEDGRRAILPSFGAYTGGLDVFDPAISCLFPGSFRVHLLAADRVYAFPKQALSRRRAEDPQ